MEQSLLDTDIFSEILKGKNPSVTRSATAYRTQFGRYTVSAITVTEIVKGFQKRGLENRIKGLLAGLASEQVLPLDIDAATIPGRIYGDLEKSGQPIGRADPMIAAIAIQNSLTLVTGNTQHFERLQRLGYPLRLANWKNPPAK